MKSPSFLLVPLLAGMFCVAAFGQSPTQSPADPVIGQWRWHWTGGPHPYIVEFRADGSVKMLGTSDSGTWQVVSSDADERQYKVSWRGGANINDMSLSPEGTVLTGRSEVNGMAGRNGHKIKMIRAERVTGNDTRGLN